MPRIACATNITTKMIRYARLPPNVGKYLIDAKVMGHVSKEHGSTVPF